MTNSNTSDFGFECTVCDHHIYGCSAAECLAPLASDFAVGDTVSAYARGADRVATVVKVGRSRLTVSYRIRSGAERTSTLPRGMFGPIG